MKSFQGVTKMMKEEVERRFEQKAMEILVAAESLIEKVVREGVDEEGLRKVICFWGADLDGASLKKQLGGALSAFSLQIEEPKKVTQVRDWLVGLSFEVRGIFKDLEKLVRLLLLILPPSTAGAERSLLRRLKTWLRGTMSQGRLNHLAIIATNREKVSMISDLEIAKEFVRGSEERGRMFGVF